MNRLVAVALFLLSALPCVPASAHHGKDFLIVESYEIPHPGDVYVTANAGWEKEDAGDATELEPSVLVGILPRLAAEVHGHFVREPDSDSFEYEAIAPAVHLQLTDHRSPSPVHVGFSAEYEIGDGEAEDAFEVRLILERDSEHSKLTANFIGEHVAGEDTEYGYAAGWRFGSGETVAVGLEAQGSFESSAGEALAAVYLEPRERMTFKIGVGAGFGDGPEAVARLGAVFRF